MKISLLFQGDFLVRKHYKYSEKIAFQDIYFKFNKKFKKYIKLS